MEQHSRTALRRLTRVGHVDGDGCAHVEDVGRSAPGVEEARVEGAVEAARTIPGLMDPKVNELDGEQPFQESNVGGHRQVAIRRGKSSDVSVARTLRGGGQVSVSLTGSTDGGLSEAATQGRGTVRLAGQLAGNGPGTSSSLVQTGEAFTGGVSSPPLVSTVVVHGILGRVVETMGSPSVTGGTGVVHAVAEETGQQSTTAREWAIRWVADALVKVVRAAEITGVELSCVPCEEGEAAVDLRDKSSRRLTAAAALKLQYMWRRAPVKERGKREVLRSVFRLYDHPRCAHGQNLARECEFVQQRGVFEGALRWQEQYVRILTQKRMGETAMALDLYCSAGGGTEGVARAGGCTLGVDNVEQLNFKARFGGEWFKLEDALDLERMRSLVVKYKPIVITASPPCQGYSSAPFAGAPSQVARVIGEVRAMLEMLGVVFIIENVMGAKSAMAKGSLEMSGFHCGRRLARRRIFEAGGGLKLRLDAAIAVPGDALGERCCLGGHSRYPRLDFAGMPMRVPCCEGNIFAVQGSEGRGCSREQAAEAMGLDSGHMSYKEMCQVVLPDHAEYLFGQVAMHVLRRDYGIAPWTYDEMLAAPTQARREMRHLVRGAGGLSASAGMSLQGAGNVAREEPHAPVSVWTVDLHADEAVWVLDDGENLSKAHVVEKVGDGEVSVGSWMVRLATGACLVVLRDRIMPRGYGAKVEWSFTEGSLRELDYTYAGGYDAVWSDGLEHAWLEVLRPTRRLSRRLDADELMGRNTLLRMGDARTVTEIPSLAMAVGAGARVTAIVDRGGAAEKALLDSGFRTVCVWKAGTNQQSVDGGVFCLVRDVIALSAGRRECTAVGAFVEAESLVAGRDRRDREQVDAPGRRTAIGWTHMPISPDRWEGMGVRDSVLQTMKTGVVIEPVEVAGCMHAERPGETAQYPWKGTEPFVQAAAECDRAMVAGHLEMVPEDEVEESVRAGHVHPWTVVQQTIDKWRACQDYSRWTNKQVLSSPFSLPSCFDVRHVVGQDSHFASFDLRDGFWGVPVAEGSRKYLMVRHPATGRLLRCRSLCFGYSLSPKHFCEVTEEIGRLFRQRVAATDRKAHIFVYVDDFLITGVDRDTTVWAEQVFADLLTELGVPWSFHKRRSACKVITFLGVVISNMPGCRRFVMAEKRRLMLVELVRAWQAREPADEEVAEAGPRELAELLGHLVFVSAVVPNGRVYMQAMLGQFKGLVVDWKRGAVKCGGEAWRALKLSNGFWRDLHWWSTALVRANSVALDLPARGRAAIVGTDASDLACGELVWIDGQREETRLVFTQAERRRPINFRETRGTLRVLELWAPRTADMTLLVDTDNTCGAAVMSNFFSKKEDLQELVRRAVEICNKYNICMLQTHTPGVSLLRPDGTSRGDAPERARHRLNGGVFRAVEKRFGPFNMFLGAERNLSAGGAVGGGPKRIFCHPTFSTVGSALRLIGEQLTTGPSTCARGIVVVPYAPTASWWGLTKHFTRVGCWRAGARQLEANCLGSWRPEVSVRDSILLYFPRAAGEGVRPLFASVADSRIEGVTGEQCCASCRRLWERPEDPSECCELCPECTEYGARPADWVNYNSVLPVGSLLYSPLQTSVARRGEFPEEAGCLYVTVEPYGGEGRPACVWLQVRGGSKADGSVVAWRDKAGFAVEEGGKLTPYRPETNSLWVVNHCGSQISAAGQGPKGEKEKWSFNWRRAEVEIAKARDIFSSLELARAPPVAGAPVLEEGMGALVEEIAALAAGAEEVTEDECITPVSGVKTRGRRVTVRPSPSYDSGEESATEARPKGRVGVNGVPLVQVGERGLKCGGCKKQLGPRMWAVTGFAFLVHNNRACVEAAKSAALAAAPQEGGDLDALRQGDVEADKELDELVGGLGDADEEDARGVHSGSEQRRAQLAAELSQERRDAIRKCFALKCSGCDEEPMICVGECGTKLHGVACAGVAKGFTTLGCFKCPECRLKKIYRRVPDGGYPEAARAMSEATMIREMSIGAEATGASFADYVGLEKKFMIHCGDFCGDMMLPRDSSESFKSFLLWLVTSADRALSLDSLWRTAGSVMVRTRGRDANLTKDADVVAFYKDLREAHGLESSPRTAATQRMVRLLFDSVLEKQIEKSFLLRRTRLWLALEIMCGLRVGEAMGGGDHHGLLADDVKLLRHLETGQISVEAKLHHSKTKFKRWVNAVGTSEGEGNVPLAQCLMDYWKELGWTVANGNLVEKKEQGYMVTHSDYTVLRVSLLGASEEDVKRLGRVLATSKDPECRRHAAASLSKGLQRHRGAASMDKKYINVTGGPMKSKTIRDTLLLVSLAGFGGDRVAKVAGPLIRGTHGALTTHMPLDPGSTYQTLHDAMDVAHKLANKDSIDPGLDVQGLTDGKPRWGHHSFRRLSDTVSRATREVTGATEQDIDLLFGWQEAFYSSKMQLHYENEFKRERRTKVTRLM